MLSKGKKVGDKFREVGRGWDMSYKLINHDKKLNLNFTLTVKKSQ